MSIIRNGQEHLLGPYYNYATAAMHILGAVHEKALQGDAKIKASQAESKLEQLNALFPGMQSQYRDSKLKYQDLRVEEFNKADGAQKVNILKSLEQQYPFLGYQSHSVSEYLAFKEKLKKPDSTKAIPLGYHIYQFKLSDALNVKYFFLKADKKFNRQNYPYVKAYVHKNQLYQVCFGDQGGSGGVNNNLKAVFEKIDDLKGDILVIGTKNLHKLGEQDLKAIEEGQELVLTIGALISKSSMEGMAVETEESAVKRKKTSKNESPFLMELVKTACCVNK